MTGLTAIVPCYNEGEQVDIAYRAVSDALTPIEHLEILFVDDGSSDDTLARVKKIAATDPRVHYLSFTRNFGLPAAVTAGFRYAGQPWSVQLDADLQFPPSQIWRLLETADQGYDLVFGIRQDRKDNALRKLGAAGTHLIARKFLHIEVPQGASSFRAVRTEVGRTIVNLPTANSHFVAKGPQIGARYTTVPVEHAAREQGSSKFRLGRLAGDAFELLLGFSWRPLNATYLLCALAALLSIVFAVLGFTGVVGASALSAVGLLASAVIAGSVAMVGRYLHRRMLDTPTRRKYYVRESNLDIAPEDTIDRGVTVAPPTITTTRAVPPPEENTPRNLEVAT
jgi:glycosyltransferase involved in cell wall biosynthesis